MISIHHPSTPRSLYKVLLLSQQVFDKLHLLLLLLLLLLRPLLLPLLCVSLATLLAYITTSPPSPQDQILL